MRLWSPLRKFNHIDLTLSYVTGNIHVLLIFVTYIPVCVYIHSSPSCLVVTGLIHIVYIYLAGGGFGDLTLAVLSIVEVCQVNVIKCCQEIRYGGGESVARQN